MDHLGRIAFFVEEYYIKRSKWLRIEYVLAMLRWAVSLFLP